MKLEKEKTVIDKVFKVIRSCKNQQQLKGSFKYMMLFIKLYGLGNTEIAKRLQLFHNLKRLKMRSIRE